MNIGALIVWLLAMASGAAVFILTPDVWTLALAAGIVLVPLAGMAGALFGLNFSSIAPDKFKFDTSILVLVFVVLGGIGNIRGSVIAAALLTVLPEVLREFGDYRMLIYAIVLIAVMLLGNAPVVRQVLERIRPAKKEVVKEGDAA